MNRREAILKMVTAPSATMGAAALSVGADLVAENRRMRAALLDVLWYAQTPLENDRGGFDYFAEEVVPHCVEALGGEGTIPDPPEWYFEEGWERKVT